MEVMGRNSGWLTAQSAFFYHEKYFKATTFPTGVLGDEGLFNSRRFDIHGFVIPELPVDLPSLGKRLKNVMDQDGCVNIFVSEGSCTATLLADLDASANAKKDAFGHLQLDEVNAGEYIANHLAPLVGADKVLVQKSG
jgi:pyrophosphate--fructose-6-phosphate 1-phosphotransferase